MLLRHRFFSVRKTSTGICEKRQTWLDMAINFKKSCCLRIGPRRDTHGMNLRSMIDRIHVAVDTLGAHFVPANYHKCSLDYVKRFFRRAANSIFGKIEIFGRIASEESLLQLTKGKCLPIFSVICSLSPVRMSSICRR